MDVVTIGAVLVAIASGAGGALGAQLWDGVVSLVNRPFRRKMAASADTAAVELAAFQQAPTDQDKAINLAAALLARSDTDDEFQQALESWWQQVAPIRASIGIVTNTISGGSQLGPVLQGRDFRNIRFGAAP